MTVVSKSHLGPRYGFVATFGAQVSPEQARLLLGYRRVVLWLDNDEAGWNGTETLIERLSHFTSILIVDSPNIEDAADLSDDVVLDSWRMPSRTTVGTDLQKVIWCPGDKYELLRVDR